MLIRWANEKDLPSWYALASDVSSLFEHPADMGADKGAGSRLLRTALQQLDTNKDISVVTFCDDCSAGKPARAVYKKFGFTNEKLTTHDGLKRSELTRPASIESEMNRINASTGGCHR